MNNMDDGLIGLTVLIITGCVLSIFAHLKIKQNSNAVLFSALAGSAIFHIFAYVHDGPKAIMFLPISFTIGAFIIALISYVVGIIISLIRRKFVKNV